QADEEIVASVGLYDDPELQAYVEDLGQRLAAESERPNLPWSFKVVDDPAVNAFALPGGYVYVTRGLLSHMESEAELCGVLGHEIGHVTARHGVNQVSKQMLAMVGLGLAVLIDDDLGQVAGAAAAGLGLLFLKYGRDDERQADDLGLRYLARSGYDPREMPGVFAVLEGVQTVEGAGRLPNWLSTHPDPGARRERMQQAVAQLPGDFSAATVNREGFLRQLDGMMFGANPREGFFAGNAFLHPEMRFRVEFPEGWETSNEKASVSAASPAQDAYLQVSLAEADTPEAAADAFFEEEGLSRGDAWDKKVHGLPARWSRFDYSDAESELSGTVAFVRHNGNVFQLLAVSTPDEWEDQQRSLEGALASFARLDDPEALNVQPQRLRLVEISRAMTLEEFDKKYPSVVEMKLLALINHVQPGERMPAGTLVKRVVEGKP
ncbi:MAG TPA: M48 family metalloprotease, partial [Thermoanaerobaculia bacterium]|nr:M48 family metalloprotease [Thermoanaerobaculia bacterium]